MRSAQMSCVCAVLAVSAARGDFVYDGIAGAYNIAHHAPIGQSFTAVDPTIHTFSAKILDIDPFNYPYDLQLTLKIRAGEGMLGPILRTVQATNIPPYHEDWLDFVFEPPLEVEVGAIYTVELEAQTLRWGVFVRGSLTDEYPQGKCYRNGAVWNNADMLFRVLAEYRPGACCLNEQCYDSTDASACFLLGGVHAGTGSYCDEDVCVPGACCDSFRGVCTMTIPKLCVWDFTQRGVSCAEDPCRFYGDCCRGETCLQEKHIEKRECEAEGGIWLGYSSLCTEVGCPPGTMGSLASFDTDFDLRDARIMQMCHGYGASGACAPADFDGDRAIELPDFAAFSDLMEGPE